MKSVNDDILLNDDPMTLSINELDSEIKAADTDTAKFLTGVRYARICLSGAIPEVRAAGVAA
jgi:hypothetical protein